MSLSSVSPGAGQRPWPLAVFGFAQVAVPVKGLAQCSLALRRQFERLRGWMKALAFVVRFRLRGGFRMRRKTVRRLHLVSHTLDNGSPRLSLPV